MRVEHGGEVVGASPALKEDVDISDALPSSSSFPGGSAQQHSPRTAEWHRQVAAVEADAAECARREAELRLVAIEPDRWPSYFLRACLRSKAYDVPKTATSWAFFDASRSKATTSPSSPFDGAIGLSKRGA